MDTITFDTREAGCEDRSCGAGSKLCSFQTSLQQRQLISSGSRNTMRKSVIGHVPEIFPSAIHPQNISKRHLNDPLNVSPFRFENFFAVFS
jgi:hypothetical protein